MCLRTLRVVPKLSMFDIRSSTSIPSKLEDIGHPWLHHGSSFFNKCCVFWVSKAFLVQFHKSSSKIGTHFVQHYQKKAPGEMAISREVGRLEFVSFDLWSAAVNGNLAALRIVDDFGVV